MVTPSAAGSKVPRSMPEKSGIEAGGSPRGTVPTVATPSWSRSSTATAAAANTIAISGPGHRGSNR